MILYKTKEEIGLIRESSLLVGKTLAEVAKFIRPGITTGALDTIAEDFIRSNRAVPGFKGYRGFPATLCISINEEVVHGIPGTRELRDADLVSIDCGVQKDGYFGDSAYTFAVGSEPEPDLKKLLLTTKQGLRLGIEAAVVGNRIGDIGNAVQSHAEAAGFSVVRELVGHGLGKNLHESPEVPNFGKKGHGALIREGLVIAIEPMINLGRRNVKQKKDGWTIITADMKPSAHFEHAIVVTKDGPVVLSTFDEIEKVRNDNIFFVN
ncbi:MAG: type I methionyl aminopeptidase [Bacteroidetes bacterium]|nr:type I methionyl aminopeptidase [Bacteroidota bacterium]MBU1720760.1 type I methionyl aminopeptidase [Bacteroidota bacterium]